VNRPKLEAILAALSALILTRTQDGSIVPGVEGVYENVQRDLMVAMPCVNMLPRAESIENSPQNFCAEIDLQVFHVSGMNEARSEDLRAICHGIRKAINNVNQIGPSSEFVVTGITYSQPGTRLADGKLILQGDVKLKIYYKEDWNG
jgi:hypothetical protein